MLIPTRGGSLSGSAVWRPRACAGRHQRPRAPLTCWSSHSESVLHHPQHPAAALSHSSGWCPGGSWRWVWLTHPGSYLALSQTLKCRKGRHLNKTMARPPQVISSNVLLTLSFLSKKIIKNLIFGIKSFLIPHNIYSKIIRRVKKKTTVVFFTVMYLKYIYFGGASPVAQW